MAVEDVYIKLENGKVEMTGNGVDVISALCFIISKLAVVWERKGRSIEATHADISVAIYGTMKEMARAAAETEAEGQMRQET